jgi:sporulation protein YlmC with PRC-barrel domain
MRLKELLGLPVIDPTSARKIGTVLDYQVDPAGGGLAAVDVTGTSGADGQRVLAARIRRVGRDAVILTGRGGKVASATAEVDERWLDASVLGGLEVIDDDGDRVGRLIDATFDQDSLEIGAYLLRVGTLQRLLRRSSRITPARVQSCSRELMLVASGRLKAEPTAPAEAEPTTQEVRVALKTDDRMDAPTLEQVQDGQNGQRVGAHSG